LRLTSSGVMNSFFVPQLGSQIYTMEGMTSQVSLQADQVGTYAGLSAQFMSVLLRSRCWRSLTA
jgi:cytochrome o ubiquinol oxidase subunit 2